MTTATLNDTTFNGWATYETWNVSLYINNEEPLYREAVRYVNQCNRLDEAVDYFQFAPVIEMLFGSKTGDGVRWTDYSKLDTEELNEMLRELVD